LGSAPAATYDGESCGQACQAVSGERRATALAKANILPGQRPCHGGHERLNSVSGLPMPVRIPSYLTR
jgi:hypothetical protein